MDELTYKTILEYRNVENPCSSCLGFGVKAYGNTSKWRHGIGGQMITGGICDVCWGSGDANVKWVNLSKLDNLVASIDRLLPTLQQDRLVNEVAQNLKALRDR